MSLKIGINSFFAGKPNQRDEDYYGDQAEYGDYNYDEVKTSHAFLL